MQAEFKIKKQKSGSYRLEITGDLIIQYSHEFRKTLMKCFENGHNLEISLANISAMDLTAVQLIQSLRNEFAATARKLEIRPPADESLVMTLRHAGFMKVIES